MQLKMPQMESAAGDTKELCGLHAYGLVMSRIGDLTSGKRFPKSKF